MCSVWLPSTAPPLTLRRTVAAAGARGSRRSARGLAAAIGCYRTARSGTTSTSGSASPNRRAVSFATASAAANSTASAECA